jgi:hypothetical protein
VYENKGSIFGLNSERGCKCLRIVDQQKEKSKTTPWLLRAAGTARGRKTKGGAPGKTSLRERAAAFRERAGIALRLEKKDPPSQIRGWGTRDAADGLPGSRAANPQESRTCKNPKPKRRSAVMIPGCVEDNGIGGWVDGFMDVDSVLTRRVVPTRTSILSVRST